MVSRGRLVSGKQQSVERFFGQSDLNAAWSGIADDSDAVRSGRARSRGAGGRRWNVAFEGITKWIVWIIVEL
eukprot:3584974-Pleurochrysis_carterae.AAC.1